MAIGMETPENILVARARSGSEDAFAELARKHSSQIYKCSPRILQNREDAEHNLQNVLPQHQQFRGQITIFNLAGAGRYNAVAVYAVGPYGPGDAVPGLPALSCTSSHTATSWPPSGKGAQGLCTKKMKGRGLTGEGTTSTTTHIRAIHFQAANGTRAIGTQSMKTKIGAHPIAPLFLIVSGNQAIITGSGTLLDSTPCQYAAVVGKDGCRLPRLTRETTPVLADQIRTRFLHLQEMQRLTPAGFRAPTMALPELFEPFNSPAGPSIRSSEPPLSFRTSLHIRSYHRRFFSILNILFPSSEILLARVS
jgi:hypothetical protein